jgi:hypothetical protein
MRVNEIKGKLDFYADALFQTGFDMGWNSIAEQLQQLSDNEWNEGNAARAEAIRWAINHVTEGTYEVTN